MNKLFLSFLVPWMNMPLWSADFTGSIAHVSSDNHTIIVTERPEQDRYTAYVTMTLDVASIQAYRAATSCELSNIISFQVAKYTNELGLSLKNDDFVIHNGNYFQQMSTNLTLSEPANVTTSLEHIDSIFSADVTHAALTLSYSRAGTYGYLSVLKSDDSVAYYADLSNGYRTDGPSRYVEYIIFNPDYVLSADVCIQDGMKAIYAKDAYELNTTHFFVPVPPPMTCWAAHPSQNPQPPLWRSSPSPPQQSAAAEHKVPTAHQHAGIAFRCFSIALEHIYLPAMRLFSKA